MTMRPIWTMWTSIARHMADHLWQSTLFCLLAAVLVFALRNNQARIRYSIWLTASLKFFIPFSLLATFGSHPAKPRSTNSAQSVMYAAVENFSQPFVAQQTPLLSHPTRSSAPTSSLSLLCAMVAAVWLAGIVVVLRRWAIGWLRVSQMVAQARLVTEGHEVDALRRTQSSMSVRTSIRLVLSQDSMEPGIFGILRPVLIWPAGITPLLDHAHIDAILAHEVCHVRRRDNLTAIFHMLVEAIFWFHPLVWWLGARLEQERERACDEQVSLLCNQPYVYAESILKVCRFCSESPLSCVSGISGADLKKRITQIMSGRAASKLHLAQRLLLLTAAMAAVAVPIILAQAKSAHQMVLASTHIPHAEPAASLRSLSTTPQTAIAPQQQPSDTTVAETAAAHHPSMPGPNAPTSQPAVEIAAATAPQPAPAPYSSNTPPKWTSVSIKSHNSASDGMLTHTAADRHGFSIMMPLGQLIAEAYGIRRESVSGLPGWADSSQFAIEVKVTPSDIDEFHMLPQREKQLILQSILAERFNLKAHTDSAQLPVYELVPSNPAALEVAQPSLYTGSSMGPGQITCSNCHVPVLVDMLSKTLKATVLDHTALTGLYDIKLRWSDATGPSLSAALEQQVGMKLISTTAPVETIVVEHVDRPIEN